MRNLISRVARRYLAASKKPLLDPSDLPWVKGLLNAMRPRQTTDEGFWLRKDRGLATVFYSKGPDSYLQFALDQGWVEEPTTMSGTVSEGRSRESDIGFRNRYEKTVTWYVTQLTPEGERALKTPAESFISKRPPLPAKFDRLADIFEGIISNHPHRYDLLRNLAKRGLKKLYRGDDPWEYDYRKQFRDLAKYYPDIIVPSDKKLFRYPAWAEKDRWIRDLVDLILAGESTDWDNARRERMIPQLRDFDEDVQYWFAFQAFCGYERSPYPMLTTDQALEVFGETRYQKLKNEGLHIYKSDHVKALREIVLRHFSSKITSKIKKALAIEDEPEVVKPTKTVSQPEKTVVDSALKEKIGILDRVIARGHPQASEVARNLKEIYLSGGRPSEDELKAIRNTLYRSGMRPEADHFRMG
jgi:hypothetical protein